MQDESIPTLHKPGDVAVPDRALVGENKPECCCLRDSTHGPEEVPRVTRHSWADIHHVEKEGKLATNAVLAVARVVEDHYAKSLCKDVRR